MRFSETRKNRKITVRKICIERMIDREESTKNIVETKN